MKILNEAKSLFKIERLWFIHIYEIQVYFLSYWYRLLMAMCYGDPLSLDIWSENIVLSHEFVDSCFITQNEYLDSSCAGCHVRTTSELFLWHNLFKSPRPHLTALCPLERVLEWLVWEIWGFVVGTIYTAVLEELNLAELTSVEFSAILSILYQ